MRWCDTELLMNETTWEMFLNAQVIWNLRKSILSKIRLTSKHTYMYDTVGDIFRYSLADNLSERTTLGLTSN